MSSIVWLGYYEGARPPVYIWFFHKDWSWVPVSSARVILGVGSLIGITGLFGYAMHLAFLRFELSTVTSIIVTTTILVAAGLSVIGVEAILWIGFSRLTDAAIFLGDLPGLGRHEERGTGNVGTSRWPAKEISAFPSLDYAIDAASPLALFCACILCGILICTMVCGSAWFFGALNK